MRLGAVDGFHLLVQVFDEGALEYRDCRAVGMSLMVSLKTLARRAYAAALTIPVVGLAAKRLVGLYRRGVRSQTWYRDPRTEAILQGLAALNVEVVHLRRRVDGIERRSDV